MKAKWNWGYSLIVVFTLLASHIGYLVYRCTQEKFDLVSGDYYNEELRYQDKIDGAGNARKISAVQYSQTVNEVSIRLPEELKGDTLTGQVWLYCPANAALDFKQPLEVNEKGIMRIDKRKLAEVRYTAKISWQAAGRQYYDEQIVAVNK